jgi:hypothetical protein
VKNYPTPEESTPEMEPEIPEEEPKKSINSWILAGCGCLGVILLLLIALFVFIDQPWNPDGGLYCRAPFDIIFGTLGFCP